MLEFPRIVFTIMLFDFLMGFVKILESGQVLIISFIMSHNIKLRQVLCIQLVNIELFWLKTIVCSDDQSNYQNEKRNASEDHISLILSH